MLEFTAVPGISAGALAELAGLFGIAVVTTDAAGTGVILNSQWQAWMAPSRPSTRDWLNALEPGDRAQVEAAIESARLEGIASVKCFVKGDTSPTPVELQFIRMQSETGELEGFVIGAAEVTPMQEMATRLERAALSTIEALSTMAAVRDLYTADHQTRVGRLSEAIGIELGLSKRQLTGLRIAAMLHDVGKVGVPIEILTKPAQLTSGEYSVMKEHAAHGYSILKGVTGEWPVARVAHEHHERLNGSGYPSGLKGDAILFQARVTAVADVVESMAVHRPYRSSLGVAAALEEIDQNKGTLYDPEAASACIRVIEHGFELY
jgi:HD-GYP domain-containing protein (c-di-GMP phosphodiesterase class II)